MEWPRCYRGAHGAGAGCDFWASALRRSSDPSDVVELIKAKARVVNDHALACGLRTHGVLWTCDQRDNVAFACCLACGGAFPADKIELAKTSWRWNESFILMARKQQERQTNGKPCLLRRLVGTQKMREAKFTSG